MRAVPVVDLRSDSAVEAWKDAFSRVGFCRLVGVGPELLQCRATLSLEAQRFFDASTRPEPNDRYGKQGFTPVGLESVSRSRGASGGADPVESLVFNDRSAPHFLPESASALQAAAWQYYDACVALARRLMQLTATALGLPETTYDAAFAAPACALRIANYHTRTPDHVEWLYGQHTDYDCLTLLCAQPTAGLEVLCQDEWIAVGDDDGADSLVVNAGDLLEHWTNGVFKSPLHRVRNLRLPQRMAIVFFCGPAGDTVVSSPKYGSVLARDHLAQKIAASNTAQ